LESPKARALSSSSARLAHKIPSTQAISSLANDFLATILKNDILENAILKNDILENAILKNAILKNVILKNHSSA
jgi:uncharacterized protein YjbI with pentapeptide repeats